MGFQLGQLRQLPGVGDTMCIRLAGGQIVTLVDLARASSAKVDSIAGRKHPFGHGEPKPIPVYQIYEKD